ncbi:hypothetical protein GCK72_013033 [Caenorhabditis remanei]|uniref:Uncharacterized protein n=1 Tax=Caenorhabditis remanei TaxID=31234 RepID=A0A6A5GMU7_CAERE|nr:hypothetical protein GCK72_013033 [Caenorhabditis remanei]KAF1756580.1 hypothetical protein GCK72_013033 [Caenorhabditis remanei]
MYTDDVIMERGIFSCCFPTVDFGVQSRFNPRHLLLPRLHQILASDPLAKPTSPVFLLAPHLLKLNKAPPSIPTPLSDSSSSISAPTHPLALYPTARTLPHSPLSLLNLVATESNPLDPPPQQAPDPPLYDEFPISCQTAATVFSLTQTSAIMCSFNGYDRWDQIGVEFDISEVVLSKLYSSAIDDFSFQVVFGDHGGLEHNDSRAVEEADLKTCYSCGFRLKI